MSTTIQVASVSVTTVAPNPVGLDLMKTGQTTSYRTGDDGDIEAGRATDFFTLAANNPFGNTNRFTDELGGQTYTNNWVIDWSTYNGSNVLGYYRILSSTNETWNNAVTNSLGTFGTFANCRLINHKEASNIMNIGASSYTNVFNYSPFNITNNFWTSNTIAGISSYGYYSNLQNIGIDDKGSAYRSFKVRTFTVTGTTLT